MKLNKFAFGTHDYRIYYVNIDLCHQYGIFVAESQTFLLTKRPSAAMSGGETSAVHRLYPNDHS